LAPTLNCNHGVGGQIVAQGVDVYNGTEDGDVAATVTSATGIANASGPKVCSWNGDVTPKSSEDVSLTLRAQQGGEGIGVATDLNVRRITPLEAERLQGLSDGFTLNKEVLELDGNIWKPTFQVVEQKDGPRYRQLGNGITAHVMEWIARRIEMVISESGK
jgi:DNA (cytosine-5)-methyltransferase 1